MDSYPGQVALVLAQPASAEWLEFSDRRVLCPSQTRGPLVRLLARYHLPFDPPAAVCDFTTGITLTLPADAARVWREAPVRGKADYLRVWGPVSVAMQRALRVWLPYTWFADLAHWDDFELACPLLVYEASRVFRPSSKHALSADLLDGGTEQAIFRSARRALKRRLPAIERTLADVGQPLTAALYHSRSRVLDSALRHRKPLRALLVAESALIEEFLSLGEPSALALRIVDGRHPRRRKTFIEEFLYTTRRRLRRFYAGQDHTQLGSMLLIEATAALAAAMGRPFAVHADVRLSRAEPLPSGSG